MFNYDVDVSSILREYCGKLLILIGVGFLLLGIMFLSPISSLFEYSWVSAVGLFLGVVLTGLGFLIELGFYSTQRLIAKLGAFLITASLPCFSSVLVVVTYSVVTDYLLIPIIFRGTIQGYKVVPKLAYPFASFSGPLIVAGICLAVTGLISRVYSEYF